jgi:aryl-alcohol dehydrogenase-like predicted oxidoreductase
LLYERFYDRWAVLEIPRVVLGCGNFGGIGSSPEFFGQGESDEEAFALMDAAWAMGLDWFDTADAYGGGRSEAAIGKWIAATGHRPRITTKTLNPMEAGADSGLSRERITRQIETSLERLGLERVEVYLAHGPDPETPLEETIGTFEELAGAGKIGAYGVSNFEPAQLRKALGAGSVAILQNSFSLLDRGDEGELVPLCVEQGVAFQAFSPLAGGWLTGKYRRGEEPPGGSRMTMRPEPYLHLRDERVYEALDRLADEAAGHGVSTAGLALAWLLAHPGVESIVAGPRRPEHLAPVREAIGLELTPEEWREIGSLFDR